MPKLYTLLFALLSSLPAWSQPKDSRLLIHNVTIINVIDGSARPQSAILLDGKTIKKIGPYKQLRSGVPQALHLDGKGRYVIPGLWDMHVHLEGTELVEDNLALLPVFLAYGITTIRDCASDLGNQVVTWRNEIRSGKRIGPRIFTAGRKLEGKKSMWKGDLEISDYAELAKSLDTLDRLKVDFVKITENTLSGDLFLMSVEAAHQRKYKVSGHVPLDVTIQSLVDAGYTSVEHGSYLLRLGYDEKSIARDVKSGKLSRDEANTRYSGPFNQATAMAGYKALAKSGLFVCPTLIGGRELAYLDETDHSKDKPLEFLTTKYTSNYQWRIDRMAGDTPEQRKARKDRYLLLRSQLPFMQLAGITLIAGSDAAALNTYVYPAESLLQELEIFREAGLMPLQILQSATINGAKYFGILDKSGTIDEGKVADLVLLDENPLENISALRNTYGVYTGGKFYSKAMLDGMLNAAKQTKVRLDASRK